MKYLYLLVLVFLPFIALSQVQFEKGYYISNDNLRIEGYIKNLENRNTVQSFEFKNDLESTAQVYNIEGVKEFGIYKVSKFQRVTVDMDRSSNELSKLSVSKIPAFEEETLFLEVLLEGPATLYFYKKGNLDLYFYNLNDRPVEQLVYKKYSSQNGSVGTNNSFRQQLYNYVNCDQISNLSIQKIDYQKKDLIKHFLNFNSCKGGISNTIRKNVERDYFNLSLRPGLSFSSFEIKSGFSSRQEKDFDDQISFRLGVEVEYILPFNKNKWSLIVEPTYRYYESTNSENDLAEYRSVEVPLGVRHYFFLSKNSALFLNGQAVVDIPLNDEVFRYDLSPDLNIALGGGFKYQKKYSVELRYFTGRNLTSDLTLIQSEFSNLSFIIGYTIL